MQEVHVRFLGWEETLEKERAATLVFPPGKPHRRRSLVGYCLRDCRVGYDLVTKQQ